MSAASSQNRSFEHMEAFSADSKNVHVIIETPQGSTRSTRVWHTLGSQELLETELKKVKI